jgi:hypothetical protein
MGLVRVGGGYQLAGGTGGVPMAAMVSSEPLAYGSPTSRWDVDALNFNTAQPVTLTAYADCVNATAYTVDRPNVGWNAPGTGLGGATRLILGCAATASGAKMLVASAGVKNLMPISPWPDLGLGLVVNHAVAPGGWQGVYLGTWNSGLFLWLVCVAPV